MAYFKFALVKLLSFLSVGLVSLTVFSATSIQNSRVLALLGSADFPNAQTLLPDGRLLEVGRIGDHLGAEIRLPDGLKTPIFLHASRQAATVTLFPNGKVLIWGGLDANNHVASGGEWFDPATNRITDAGDVSLLPRAGQAATILTDGRLLVTGGWNSTAGTLTKSELWDYRTNRSEILAADWMPARAGHSATLLADGRVLLLGGYNAEGHRFLNGTLFDPNQITFVNVDASTQVSLASQDAAPDVAETIPSDQAKDFPIDGLIALRFSVLMDVTSLQTNSITLLGPSGPVAVEVVPAESGRLVFVQPNEDLLPSSNYSLFVDGAHEANGTPLAMKAISFSTGTGFLRSASGATSSSSNHGATASRDWSDVTSSGTKVAGSGIKASTLPVQVMAGSAQALSEFRATCTNTRTIHGHRFCRETGTVDGGIFIPGHSNTQARWRLNTALPKVPTEKDFPDNTFRAGVSAVYGIARRVDDVPLAGVSVSIGAITARTDAQGRFVLQGVPNGHQILLVDGRTANHGVEEYGLFTAALEVQSDRANAVPFNLYIPRISARDKITIPSPTTTAMVVTHPAIPGLEIHIPAGVAFRDRAGKIITEFAMVPMPVDRSPVPVPQNFPVYLSMQPGGATVEGLTSASASGLRVVYPNYVDAIPSDAELPFWYYDAEGHGWDIYTTGQVSDDGSQVNPRSPLGGLTFMPQGGANVGGPKPPPVQPKGCSKDGDPVDCATGLFLLDGVDLAVNDPAPLAMTRMFNASDTTLHAFGPGMSNFYGMYLTIPAGGCVHTQLGTIGDELDLVMGDGSVYRFILNSSDPMQPLYHTGTPSRLYGAALYPPYPTGRSPVPGHFILQTQDGTRFQFSDNACPTVTQLEAITDRFGNSVSLTYTAGLLSGISSTSGRALSLSYNGNLVSQVSDSSGRNVGYAYNGSNQLTTVSYPDGTSEQYTYDGNGNIATVKDRAGNTKVTNYYDGAHRVIQQTYADGSSYHFAYNGTTTDVTDGNGNIKRIVFDGAGYPTSITRAYGTSLAQTTTLVRGQNELITSRTDPMGRRTQYVYDSKGNALQTTYLAGTSNAATYTFTYTPDGFNQVSTVTDPSGHTTSYSYSNGCLTAIVDALGHTMSITCNAAGQPTVVTDANGHNQIFTYSGSDLHTVTNALGQTTTFTTDGLGRVTSMQDPLNRVSSVVYDSNGRVTQSTDPLQQKTTYTYDGNGNLKTVTDPNNGKTQFGYDGRNRPTSRTDAINHQETVVYDGMGNVLTATDRKGQVTRAQYDALNRPTVVTFADNSTITPTFDTGNRLTQIVDSISGTITRGYDSLDRLTQEQTPQGTVSYGYDAANRRTSMTPASQAQITYTYDAADRLTQITQGSQTVGLAYDAANRRTTLTLPNGIVASYAYDNADQLTSMTYQTSSGTTLSTIGYTYDAAGQRTSRSGGFAAETLPAPTTANGVFDLNNRQTMWNGASLSYDGNGDPTANNAPPAQTYTFDARKRLTQIVQGGSTLASFTYDAMNRRTSKTINGTTTTFLYDGQSAVQETQGSSIAAILTGMGIDERYSRDDANMGKAYYLTDALGSTLALADGSQAVRQTYAYEPYGEMTSTGSSNNPYQYTGRENDGTGLYYYRNRYYSPTWKRFISEDPLGLYGGLNGYAYVGDNPLSFTDPLGLMMSPKGELGCGAGQSWADCVAGVPPTQLQLPDYVNFGFGYGDWYASSTYTRCGDVFAGFGYAGQNTDGNRFPSVNISVGFVLGSRGSRTNINNVVGGLSGSASFYQGVGGGVHINDSGTAVDVGVGFGRHAWGGDYNWYRGNLFDTFGSKSCGCE